MEKYEKDELILNVAIKTYLKDREKKNKKCKTKFKDLSYEERQLYINYSICAYNVYEQLCWADLVEESEDIVFRDFVGFAMHVEWLCMNKTCKKTYDKLYLSVKSRYLNFYDNLLDIVKKNDDKYFIDSVEDYDILDYENSQRKILGLPEINDSERRFNGLCAKDKVYIKIG